MAAIFTVCLCTANSGRTVIPNAVMTDDPRIISIGNRSDTSIGDRQRFLPDNPAIMVSGPTAREV